MPDKIRTFIAAILPLTVKKTITDAQMELKNTPADIKWVKPSQAHLTLNFLGDVEKERIPAIALMMKQHLSRTDAFSVELSNKVEAFPNLRKPQVLWIGIKDPHGSLEEIARILSHQLQMLGFAKDDREFRAHITIGRVRSNQNINTFNEKVAKLLIPSVKFSIQEVSLFKSTLTSNGPLYENLQTIPLVDQ